jgi:hypothetical protein
MIASKHETHFVTLGTNPMKLLTIAELTVQLKALTASQTEVTLNLWLASPKQ